MDDAASAGGTAGDGAAPRISLGKGRALVAVPAARRADFASGLGRSHGVVAATVAVVMGVGFVAGTAVFASKPQAVAVARAVPPADTTMDVLYRVQGEVRSLKASLDGLRASAEDGRQADTIRGLKKSVDVLKQDIEGAKAASAGAVGQLGAKIDKLDRDPGPKLNEIAARLDKLDHDPSPKLAEISARLDRMDREPDAKIAQVAAQLATRLDRIERQVASPDATASIPPQGAAAPQAKAPPPAQHAAAPVVAEPPPRPEAASAVPPARPDAAKAAPAPRPEVASAVPPVRPDPAKAAPAPRAEVAAAVPPARPESAKVEPSKPDAARPELVARVDAGRQPRPQDVPPKPATVDGWLLRDVYGGVALVEGRAGGLREVAPGEYVPGVGEIRSIERRGRGWVVVTSRGIIQADNRW